jgi:hypothetical protein
VVAPRLQAARVAPRLRTFTNEPKMVVASRFSDHDLISSGSEVTILEIRELTNQRVTVFSCVS